MALRIRQYDWASTPLGPINGWPERLRACVDLLLDSPLIMNLMWGEDAIQLYNDAYAASIGVHHPAALGHSVFSPVSALQDTLEPLVRRAWAGESVTVTDLHVRFDSRFPRPEAWFDLACSPVRNPAGETAGVLAILTETTERIGAAPAITSRNEVEAALSQSEERYRTLFESIDQGFCVIEVLFDPSGLAVDYVFLEINPAFARNTGLVDAVGNRMRDLAPTHEEYWFETYGRIALTGTSERFEHEAAALGRWYNVYAYRVGEPDQHRVAVLFEDITASKAADAAVRASEERYRTLVQNIVDYAIFMLDADGLVTEWPEGAQHVKGYAPEEVIGQHVSIFYPPEELAGGDPARELAEAAATGRAEREAWRLRKGGKRFWGNEIATAIRDDAGRLIGYTKITRDLTDRRKTEEALRESEERFRGIVETATDYAIFSVDPHGIIDGWYAGAEAIFRWSEAEAIGMPMDVTYTPADRVAGVPAQERETARQHGAAPNVRWHRRRDGTPVFIDGVARARYAADGQFLGVFKIGQDVTDRWLAQQRQQEEQGRIRQELQDRVLVATSEVRDLSRQLLLAQEEERRHLALELHDDFGQVLTGLALALSAKNLTESRLAEARQTVAEVTARIRHRSMELRPATLDSYGLLPTLHWHLERYQRQTGITVALQQEGVDRRFTPAIEIAAYRIVQEALTNVARHAQADHAIVQLFADEVALTVAVRDHGTGYDPSAITPGSGLGGMRERAELLGGTFEIDTLPGGGVALTAEIPLNGDPGIDLDEEGETP
jgi:PAS domain S-box-containing protein